VLFQNNGTSIAYLNLGTSSSVTATTSGISIAPGAAFGLTVGSNTYYAAITASSTATINTSGGTGLVAGYGASGSGSGGGGTITASAGSYSIGALVDGSIVTLGTKSDAAYGGSGSATLIAIEKANYAELLSLATGVTVSGGTVTANLGTIAGAATAANQTSVQTAPGTSASTANAVQGVTNGVALNVSGVTGNAITSNQQTATSTATALPSATYTNGIVITASSSNTGKVCVGGSGVTTSTGYCLAAGTSISYGVNNSNLAYIIDSTAGDIVYVTGN